MTPALSPTAEQEQQAIIDAVAKRQPLSIAALPVVAKPQPFARLVTPIRTGLYLAYNRAILAEARARFPPNIT